MTLERDNSATRQTLYRRLSTGADTVMSDFAAQPSVTTDSSYRGLEMTRQWVTCIRLCRYHLLSSPIHMRVHNNTKLKSP